MTYKRPESVLVVLHDGHGHVLVLQRNDDPNFWQSVTGTLEQGETPLQTAYREVAEETGITLDAQDHQIVDCRQINQYQIRPQWLYRYAPDVTINTEHVFAARIDRNSPLSLTEHSASQWLVARIAAQKVWSDTNRQAILAFVPGADQ